MKKALIFQGGWDGHEPKLVSKRFAGLLEKNGYEVNITDNLDTLLDREYLMSLDLIIPCWTMGSISGECRKNVCDAVANGTGLAGCHGGMCDSFREDTEWQFMTGGQWVSHPGGDGTDYIVNIDHGSSHIIEGIEDFPVCSEQYYLHVDPAVEVLATTRFPVVNYYHASNKKVDMPVVWTKYWGCGRVFYNSLGHHDDVFDKSPSAETIMERGMLWAGAGKEYAVKNGLSAKKYEEE
ncbi:MAG: ThuA domain-containing protein [Clostridia bacterium]|nr:ThuA domain-containing protein [Clostridia bacterium]